MYNMYNFSSPAVSASKREQWKLELNSVGGEDKLMYL